MAFSYLPDELIDEIVPYLSGDDLIQLSQTSKQFNNLCNCHTSWLNVLMQYKIRSGALCYNFGMEDALMEMDWIQLRSMYKNAFRRWGWITGFWHSHIPAFGGLLFVQLKMSPCRIVGYSVQASLSAELITHLVPMFIIDIERSEGDSFYFDDNKKSCVLYSMIEHQVAISLDDETGCDQPLKMRVQCQCKADDFSKFHNRQKLNSDFSAFLGRNHELVLQTLLTRYQINGWNTYSKLEIPHTPSEKTIIAPGFFAGDYSAYHGNEILMVTYNANEMKFTKMSGDKNVRSGVVSILADLSHPVDYLGVLTSLVKRPDEFNVTKLTEEFRLDAQQISLQQMKEEAPIFVDEALIDLLRRIDRDLKHATFDDTEKDLHSYIAAFKGRITLGMMPEVANPEYYYHDVLVVVTSEDTLLVFIPFHDEYQTGIRTIYKQRIRRLCFEEEKHIKCGDEF